MGKALMRHMRGEKWATGKNYLKIDHGTYYIFRTSMRKGHWA